MGPLIPFLQAALSLAATSASLHDLNPRRSFSLFVVLRHVSLGRPLLRLPSGCQSWDGLRMVERKLRAVWKWKKFFRVSAREATNERVVRCVVLKRTVGDSDWRFDNLSGSHLQSQNDIVSSVDGIYVSGDWPDWSIKLSCYWPWSRLVKGDWRVSISLLLI